MESIKRPLLGPSRQVAATAFALGAWGTSGMTSMPALAQTNQTPVKAPRVLSVCVNPAIAAVKCDSSIQNRLRQTAVASASGRPVSGWTSVIVAVSRNGDMTDADRERTFRALGSDIYKRLPLISATAVRVPNRNLARLAALPFVTHLSLDSTVVKNDEFTVDRSGAAVAMNQYGATGQGVTVAILDSGIRSTHPDFWQNLSIYNLMAFANANYLLTFPNRIVASVNFSASPTAEDLCGHGTHVAGIVAGNGMTSDPRFAFRTFYGIARQANLVNVKVLDDNGQGTVSSVISGINWVVQNKATYNIRVLNLSLGHPVAESYKTDPLCQAVEAAWKAGIVVVCAAGNNGRANSTNNGSSDNEGWGTKYGSIQSPGNDPYVITVGAMKNFDGIRSDDRIATYSSRGPTLIDNVAKPDLVAPGNRIISTMTYDAKLASLYSYTNVVPLSAYVSPLTIINYPQYFGTVNSRSYFALSGTSMAAPVVTGAVALLLQQDSGLSPDTVKARLMLSADKWVGPNGKGDLFTYGAGYLNIPAALRNPAIPNRAALSPTTARDTKGNVILDPTASLAGTVNGTQVIWGGTGTLWGIAGVTSLQVLWGPSAVTDVQVVTGTQVIWGGTASEVQAIWGSQVIWGGTSPNTPVSAATATVDLSSVSIQGEP